MMKPANVCLLAVILGAILVLFCEGMKMTSISRPFLSLLSAFGIALATIGAVGIFVTVP